MASDTGRDDFIIAIRSAFLKKATKQRFSLFALMSFSIALIVLSNLNFSAINYLYSGINEVVYRISFVASVPEKKIHDLSININEHMNLYKNYKEKDKKLKEIYSTLDPWQTTMVARHEDRPKSKFFIDNLFEDFISLAGDRYYGEDKSVITGFAKFNGQSVLVIGQEKGENLEARIERNFGMMRP